MIDVLAGTMSFQLCGERVDFCFPQSTPSSLLATLLPPAAHVHTVPIDGAPGTAIFYGDGGPHMWPTVLQDIPPQILTSFRITSACTEDVVDPTPQFHTSTSTPPMSLPFAIIR